MSSQPKGLVNLKQRQRYLQIGVFSLITVMVWVGFSLIRSQKNTSISAELQALALPLIPTINKEVIEDLENKHQYTTEELANFPIYKIIVSDKTKESNIVTIDTDPELINPSSTAQPQSSPSSDTASASAIPSPTASASAVESI